MSKAAELAALIGSGQAQGDKNFIINGAQKVSQRGTSFTGQGANGSAFFTDRWYCFSGGSSAGRFTATQETITDLAGFTSALKLDCTTADTSIGADEQLSLIQSIEAQNLQSLGFGTSGAKPLVFSFYAKANANKTYVAELYKNDTTLSSQSHTFAVTTSWQRFEIPINNTNASSIGTIVNDNGVGFYWLINLHAGSNLTSGTINSTWLAATQANRMPGCGSFFSSTDNTFFMTGASLEIGEVATPFEHEDIGTTLAKCLRYYYRIGGASAYHRYGVGSCQGTNSCGTVIYSPVGEMRDVPSLETTGTASDYAIYEVDGVNACTSIPALNSAGTNSKQFNTTFTSSGNLASGNAAEALANNNADAFLAFKAES